jgi:hypothetical protein
MAELRERVRANWQNRVEVSLAGVGELRRDSLVNRSVAVAERLEREA